MVKSKVSRKELLNKPDEFISKTARAIIFAKEHEKQLQYIGIAIVVLVLIWIGTSTYMGRVNKKGQEAFNIAYFSITNNIATGIDDTKLNESEGLFKQVTDNYGMSKAATLALPELAYIKYMQKEYDAAIDLYQQFQDEISADDPYQSLTNLALAVCFEEKGDMDNAINILEQITEGEADYFKEQAMLNLSRIYSLANQEDKSQEMLKDFVEKYQQSPFLAIAKARLKS